MDTTKTDTDMLTTKTDTDMPTTSTYTYDPESEGPKETTPLPATHDTTRTYTSLLSPDDLTNEQVCKIIIALAKMVIEENSGKDIKFKKEEKR